MELWDVAMFVDTPTAKRSERNLRLAHNSKVSATSRLGIRSEPRNNNVRAFPVIAGIFCSIKRWQSAV